MKKILFCLLIISNFAEAIKVKNLSNEFEQLSVENDNELSQLSEDQKIASQEDEDEEFLKEFASRAQKRNIKLQQKAHMLLMICNFIQQNN